jgi:hypothetical protein
MNDYLERPVLFGPDGSLIGMLATPAEGPAEPVACLLMNMGANHRIGPRRINVKIARELAAHGIGSIRIDLAGMGDSRPASGLEHYRTQAVLDLQAAMDCIESELGIRRFVGIGLCSGCENILASAVADTRVIGVLMFDGFAFPGRRSRWEKTIRRTLADPSLPTLMAKVKGKLRRFMPGAAAAQGTAPVDDDSTDIFKPESPEEKLDFFHSSMRLIAERKVKALLVYSATLHVRDRDRDQLGALGKEPFMRQFEYRFTPDMDHSMLSREPQQAFLSICSDWALRVIRGNAALPRERKAPQPKLAAMADAGAPVLRTRRPSQA